MGVVGDKGELPWAGADYLCDKMTQYGVLNDIKGKTKRNIGRARSNENIEAPVDQIPLRIPDAGWQSGGFEPLILP